MRPGDPSATAALIARAMVFLARDPRRGALVPPGAAEMSAACLEALDPPGAVRFLSRAGRPWFRALVAVAERFTLPGVLLHWALRKQFLEDTARRSLAEGFAQLVVVGAGFDTLALRLHRERPDLRCWEVDHPATQEVKRRALARRGLSAPGLRLVAADLAATPLADALAAAGFDAAPPTLFVAEGVLMYVDEGGVAGLLASIAARGPGRSRLAFTFMERDGAGRVRFRNSSLAIGAWLALRGEPFRWGIARSDLGGFVARTGLALREVAGAAELRGRYLGADSTAPLAEGESIAVCEPVS